MSGPHVATPLCRGVNNVKIYVFEMKGMPKSIRRGFIPAHSPQIIVYHIY